MTTNDPYGNPYGQPGYGQDPYGQSPYAHGYPAPPPSKGPAIGATVAGGLATLFCCLPLGIVGLILGIMALTKSDTEPESAKKLTLWSYISSGAGAVLGIVTFIVYIVVLLPMMAEPS